MTKGETIEYAIRKECQRVSLADWCKTWNITLDEFNRFLELRRQGFDKEDYKKALDCIMDAYRNPEKSHEILEKFVLMTFAIGFKDEELAEIDNNTNWR